MLIVTDIDISAAFCLCFPCRFSVLKIDNVEHSSASFRFFTNDTIPDLKVPTAASSGAFPSRDSWRVRLDYGLETGVWVNVAFARNRALAVHFPESTPSPFCPSSRVLCCQLDRRKLKWIRCRLELFWALFRHDEKTPQCRAKRDPDLGSKWTDGESWILGCVSVGARWTRKGRARVGSIPGTT